MNGTKKHKIKNRGLELNFSFKPSTFFLGAYIVVKDDDIFLTLVAPEFSLEAVESAPPE